MRPNFGQAGQGFGWVCAPKEEENDLDTVVSEAENLQVEGRAKDD